jgi:hypothetical protein
LSEDVNLELIVGQTAPGLEVLLAICCWIGYSREFTMCAASLILHNVWPATRPFTDRYLQLGKRLWALVNNVELSNSSLSHRTLTSTLRILISQHHFTIGKIRHIIRSLRSRLSSIKPRSTRPSSTWINSAISSISSTAGNQPRASTLTSPTPPSSVAAPIPTQPTPSRARRAVVEKGAPSQVRGADEVEHFSGTAADTCEPEYI